MAKKWKTLFFLLLGINLAVLLVIAFLMFSPTKEHPGTSSQNPGKKMVPFMMESNKEDLTRVINYYIEEQAKGGGIDYHVLLTDEVELYGTIEVFTQEIELKMTFEPEALENGDLLLTQKSMSLGSLPLPVEYVLKFINDHYALPEWVTIKPDERKVYVGLMNMKTDSGMKIGAERFDLKNDSIRLLILLPGKDGS